MYSPQRYKVLYQRSPLHNSSSPGDWRTSPNYNNTKRKSPAAAHDEYKMTWEEFIASKKKRKESGSPSSRPPTTKSLMNKAAAITPIRKPVPNRSLTSRSPNSMTRSSPNRTTTTTPPAARSSIVPNRNSVSIAAPTRRISIFNRTATATTTSFKATAASRYKSITSPTTHRTFTSPASTKPASRHRTTTTTTTTASHSIKIHTNKPKPTSTLYHNNSSPSITPRPDQKIRVCVRKRPLNKTEKAANEQDIAPLSGSRTIKIHAPRQKVDLTRYTEQHAFTFDDVFDSNTSNRTIYQKTAHPLVDYMFQGGKATCFAYGQTGSGKTYTMLDSNHGLYVQATSDIFGLLNQSQYAHLQAWVGYYEIYQGQLFDLLNTRKQLIPREDGKGNVIITGLKEHRIHSSDTMMDIFDFGNRIRTTCKTNSNESSSRSHAVLQILLKTTTGVYGKLSFIDLAGSERGTDRGINSDIKIRLEGAEINRSLLALKECIRALDQDKRHAPFRGSKLTMVLKDSFVGNSKTCMIATVSPNHSNSDHILNTLRYADRVKELRGESDPRLAQEEEEQVQSSKEHQPSQPSVEQQRELITTVKQEQPQETTKDYIIDFLQWHHLEIQGNESYLHEATKLIDDLTMHLDEFQHDQDFIYQKSLDYLQNMNNLLNQHKNSCQDLKDRIKEELTDEDDYE